MLKAAVCVVLLILTPLLSVLSGATAQLDLTSERVKGVYCDRPPHSQHAAMARYTVHRNTWGSVATFSQHLSGFPFSNVVSYSDGALGNSTGRLIFFLTAFDVTAADIQVDSHITLSVAEAQIPGACPHTDPEDPICARVSISGHLLTVPAAQLDEARQLLFSRHPAMEDWHAHKFTVYELDIMTVQLLDYYGGYAELSPQEYFAAKVSCSQAAKDRFMLPEFTTSVQAYA